MAALTAFVLLLWFAWVGGPERSNVLLGLAAVALAAFAALQAQHGAVGRAGWPYAVFLLTLLVSQLVTATTPWIEIGRQVLFVTTILSTTTLAAGPRRAAVAATLFVGSLSVLLVTALGTGFAPDSSGRAVGYLGTPQWSGYPELGLLASVGIAGALGLALGGGPRGRLAWGALALALGFVALALGSRSALATIAVLVLWLMTMLVARRQRWTRSTLAAAAAGWVLVALLGVSALGARERQALASNEAFASRLAGWRAAVTLFAEHPWAGVGPAQYPWAYRARFGGGDSTHAYNLVLQAAAETGLVGLAGTLLIWSLALGRTAAGAIATTAPGPLLACHGMLLAFFVRSQSEHFLSNLPTSFRTLLVLGVLFGLAESARQPAPCP